MDGDDLILLMLDGAESGALEEELERQQQQQPRRVRARTGPAAPQPGEAGSSQGDTRSQQQQQQQQLPRQHQSQQAPQPTSVAGAFTGAALAQPRAATAGPLGEPASSDPAGSDASLAQLLRLSWGGGHRDGGVAGGSDGSSIPLGAGPGMQAEGRAADPAYVGQHNDQLASAGQRAAAAAQLAAAAGQRAAAAYSLRPAASVAWTALVGRAAPRRPRRRWRWT